MGNFYTNFTVFGASAEEVLAVALELRRTAYVMQSSAGGSVLFDCVSDQQDVDEIERLGAVLSGRLNSPVLACLNHDDDHLLLWIFREEKKEGFYQIVHRRSAVCLGAGTCSGRYLIISIDCRSPWLADCFIRSPSS